MFDRIAGEALGTFIFAFIIAAADVEPDFTGNNGHPFSLGGGAIILMMIAGFSADPHLNPAITLGHYIRHALYKGLDGQSMIEHSLIILVQFIFAFPGAYLGWGLNDTMMYFSPSSQANHQQAFLAEFVFTSLVVSTALMIGKTNDSRILGCVGLGAAYFSGVMCVSYYSGACFNPALGLSINIVKYTQDGSHLKDTWIYVLAPFAGGIFGGLFNSLILIGAEEKKDTEIEELIMRED